MCASCEIIIAGMWELWKDIVAAGWDLTHAIWMYGSENMQIQLQCYTLYEQPDII